MSCHIGSLSAYKVGCKTIGGIREIWLAEWNEVSGSDFNWVGTGDNGSILPPASPPAAKPDFYRWELRQNSANYTEPPSDDNTAGSHFVTQTLNVNLHGADAALAALANQIGRGQFQAIIFYRNGKIRVAGLNKGLESDGGDGSFSGEGAGDAQGTNFNLTAESEIAAPYMLPADLSDLQAAINLIEVV